MNDAGVGANDIPGFRLIRLIGHGGMADVWMAEQISVGRSVAVKLFRSSDHGPGFTERFVREGQLSARLNHPYIVTVYDVGLAGEWHYIAMELVEGGRMEIPPQGFVSDQALHLLRPLAQALAYAHKRGVIHRDIKPENVLINEVGEPVLTDFGVARAMDDTSGLTIGGMILGTAQYMSPEQARGAKVDHRSDIYSLGAVFFEMLTGRPPYEGGDPLLVGLQHVTKPIPELPEKLSALQPLITKLLAKKPEDRFSSADELLLALAELHVNPERPSAPPLVTREPARSIPAQQNEQADTSRAPGISLREAPAPVATPAEPVAPILPPAPSVDPIHDRPTVVREAAARPAAKAKSKAREPMHEVAPAEVAPSPRKAVRAATATVNPQPEDSLPLVQQVPGSGPSDERAANSPPASSLPPSSSAAEPTKTRATWWIAAGFVVVALGVAGWLYSEHVSGGAANLLAQTEASLSKDDLDLEEARRLIEWLAMARSIDGDSSRVRRSADRMAISMLARSAADATKADQEAALNWLDLAAQTEASDPQLTRAIAVQREGVKTALREKSEAAVREALAQGSVHGGPRSALDLLKRLEAADPGGTSLETLRSDVLTALAEMALSEAGDLAYNALKREASAHPQLPAIETSRLARTEAAGLEQQVNEMVAIAEAAEAENRLRGRDGAVAAWQRVLTADPANAMAKAALDRIGAGWLSQADRWIREREPERAMALLEEAETLLPGNLRLASLKTKAQEVSKDVQAMATGPAPGTPEAARLSDLLDRAEQAFQRGDLLSPMAESAFDLWRAAQRIAPSNPEAQAGLASLSAALLSKFDRELAAGSLSAAEATLIGARGSAIADEHVGAMTNRLAESYAREIEVRATTSREDALRQLDRALRATPGNPRLTELQERLKL